MFEIHGDDPLDKTFVAETQTAATKAGIQLQVVSVSKPEQLDRTLSRMTNGRVGAVIVPANLPVPAHEIAQSALRHRLPMISLLSQYPESGAAHVVWREPDRHPTASDWLRRQDSQGGQAC